MLGEIIQNKNKKTYSALCFSLFFVWLLSFPFEGQILYALSANAGIDGATFSLWAVLAHFLGLFSCGFIVKKQAAAKMTMIVSTVVCISGSIIFFLPFSYLWYVSIAAMAYFAGLVVACWGFYFKLYSSKGERLKTAADVLIFTNVGMVLINAITVALSVWAGLIITIFFLLAALLSAFRLETQITDKRLKYTDSSESSTFYKPLIFLCLFICIITINSGLMYQVVNPAFSHLGPVAAYYWAVPYIAALIVLRNLSSRVSPAYILYIAMAMIGVSFVSFMLLDRSLSSYLIIDTLMLGAFGVCDLFWWSIIGGFLDYSDNPAQVFGMGLSMNVLGILVGGTIGKNIGAIQEDPLKASALALVVILVVLMLLPLLNIQLTRLIKNHVFLFKFSTLTDMEQEKVMKDFGGFGNLTEKETEVVKLLLKGYTYKAISESLFISENTMKFHVKNIYQKLDISSKMELIRIFSDKEK